jgi:hypothetical protein
MCVPVLRHDDDRRLSSANRRRGDLGVAGPDFGVARGDLGVAGPDFGVAGPDFGVARGDVGGGGPDFGVEEVLPLRRLSGEDDPSFQPDDVVSCRDVGTIMSDAEDSGAAFGLLGEDSAGTRLALSIKPRGRFVQNEDLG